MDHDTKLSLNTPKPRRKFADPVEALPYDGMGFDVTCVIGRVELTEIGEPAHVVAFRMIAEHDAEGHYSFPRANGGTVNVTVEYGV
jgi:hypothetical protein